MATIKQIADLAGVSRGTVDRVLNNRGGVSAETQKRIQQIITSLNFTPSKAGQNLAICKKNLKFGFIMFGDAASHPFFSEVAKGIVEKAEELKEYGVTVEMLYSEFDNYEHQIQLLEQLEQKGVSGIAITPINHPAVAQKLRSLVAQKIPVVTVNSDIEGSGRLAYVGSNYYKCGETAGGLLGLITGGRANVGIVYGSQDVLCHSQRIAGFEDKVSAAYPEIRVVASVSNHDDDIESYEVTKRLLAKHPEIDALFLVSAGVYGTCRAVLAQKHPLTIICYDCTPSTCTMIRKGVIQAAIDQQPVYQGSKPLDILFNAIALNTMPPEEYFFTNIEIKIAENL